MGWNVASKSTAENSHCQSKTLFDQTGARVALALEMRTESKLLFSYLYGCESMVV